MTRCNHDNVIKIHTVFASDEHFHIIMELFDGNNLFKILKEKKQLEEFEVRNIIRKICLALNYLH